MIFFNSFFNFDDENPIKPYTANSIIEIFEGTEKITNLFIQTNYALTSDSWLQLRGTPQNVSFYEIEN